MYYYRCFIWIILRFVSLRSGLVAALLSCGRAVRGRCAPILQLCGLVLDEDEDFLLTLTHHFSLLPFHSSLITSHFYLFTLAFTFVSSLKNTPLTPLKRRTKRSENVQ